MSRVGPGRPPLTRGPTACAAGDVQHRAFVPDEQAQQFDERGAIKSASGAIRRRLNCDRIADARDGKPLLAPQVCAEYRSRRAPGGAMTEQPRRRMRRQARHARHPPHGPPRSTPAGIGEHEIRVRPAADEPQQRFDVRGLDTRVFTHELLELGQLHLDGGRQAQALHQQFVGEFGEPIFDGGIEILDRLEDGERDDAVHH